MLTLWFHLMHASCNTTLTLILNVTQGSALTAVVPVYYMLVRTIN